MLVMASYVYMQTFALDTVFRKRLGFNSSKWIRSAKPKAPRLRGALGRYDFGKRLAGTRSAKLYHRVPY